MDSLLGLWARFFLFFFFCPYSPPRQDIGHRVIIKPDSQWLLQVAPLSNFSDESDLDMRKLGHGSGERDSRAVESYQ